MIHILTFYLAPGAEVDRSRDASGDQISGHEGNKIKVLLADCVILALNLSFCFFAVNCRFLASIRVSRRVNWLVEP